MHLCHAKRDKEKFHLREMEFQLLLPAMESTAGGAELHTEGNSSPLQSSQL